MEVGMVQFISDLTACVLGTVFNSILIVAILRVTDHSMRSYSYLLLASASFDLFFSIIEFCTLHQLLTIDGTILVMSRGFVERALFPYVGPLLMIPHVFAANHGLLILAAQYHYRYVIVTKGNASKWTLIRDLSFTTSLGWIMALMAWWGSMLACERGRDYYLPLTHNQSFYIHADRYFLYATDTQDFITLAYFKSSFWWTWICFAVSIYYAVRAFCHIRQNRNLGNPRTVRLQSQFTRSLIVQTINTMVFALIPLSFSSVPMQLTTHSQLPGFITMTMISWLGTANGMWTLYIVRKYRRFFFSVMGCHGVFAKMHVWSHSDSERERSHRLNSLQQSSEGVLRRCSVNPVDCRPQCEMSR